MIISASLYIARLSTPLLDSTRNLATKTMHKSTIKLNSDEFDSAFIYSL